MAGFYDPGGYAGGGGGGTLQDAYNGGSSITLTSAGGAVNIKDASPSLAASLFAVSSGSNTLFDVQPSAPHVLLSAMADGASAIALKINTATAWSNATAKLLSLQANGTEVYSFLAGTPQITSKAAAATSFTLKSGNSSSGTPSMIFDTTVNHSSLGDIAFSFAAAGTSFLTFAPASGSCDIVFRGGALIRGGGSVQITVNLTPLTQFQADLGTSGTEWKNVYARGYYGIETTLTSTATPAWNPASSGETQRMVLTANVTSWTIGTGVVGQRIQLHWIQDGTGGFTIAGPPANVKLSAAFGGGDTANKRSVLTLNWDTVTAAWIETARAVTVG